MNEWGLETVAATNLRELMKKRQIALISVCVAGALVAMQFLTIGDESPHPNQLKALELLDDSDRTPVVPHEGEKAIHRAPTTSEQKNASEPKVVVLGNDKLVEEQSGAEFPAELRRLISLTGLEIPNDLDTNTAAELNELKKIYASEVVLGEFAVHKWAMSTIPEKEKNAQVEVYPSDGFQNDSVMGDDPYQYKIVEHRGDGLVRVFRFSELDGKEMVDLINNRRSLDARTAAQLAEILLRRK